MAKQSMPPDSTRQSEGAPARPFHVSPEPVIGAETSKRSQVREDSPTPIYEELGILPPSYGSRTLYLIARDPHYLFTYWDIEPGDLLSIEEVPAGAKLSLSLCQSNGFRESVLEIDPMMRNCYLRAQQADTAYYAELGYTSVSGEWKTLLRSEVVATPPEELSQEVTADFATLPFHLTFQKLLELVKGNLSTADGLVGALSQLQADLHQCGASGSMLPDWDPATRNLLSALVGGVAAEKGGASSTDHLRQRLNEISKRQSGRELLTEPEWAALWAAGSGGSVSESLGSRV